MTSTEKFQQHIEQYLREYAQKEVGFSDKLNNPDKSIEKCCEYIISEVKKSGRNGFDNEEIYGMAIHYYDEKNISYKKVSCQKIVGPYELTEQEKAEAKQNAIKQYQDDLVNQMKHPAKPARKNEEVSQTQMSLF
jgi:hypothetical protein